MGFLLREKRDRLAGLLSERTPVEFPALLLLGMAIVLVRGFQAGPPGGWRAQARLRRALRGGTQPVVLTGRLEPSTLRTGSTMPVDFLGRVSGTLHFDNSFDPTRVRRDFAGESALCWLPGTKRARWRTLHAAVLVAGDGRYAPVGITRLPAVDGTRAAPMLDDPVGPYPWASGRSRGMLVFATLLAFGAACSGVFVPSLTSPSGTGVDNDGLNVISGGAVYQCGALLVPLLGFAVYRLVTGPDASSGTPDPTASPTGAETTEAIASWSGPTRRSWSFQQEHGLSLLKTP